MDRVVAGSDAEFDRGSRPPARAGNPQAVLGTASPRRSPRTMMQEFPSACDPATESFARIRGRSDGRLCIGGLRTVGDERFCITGPRDPGRAQPTPDRWGCVLSSVGQAKPDQGSAGRSSGANPDSAPM